MVVRLPTRWDHHFEARRRRRERWGWSTAVCVFISVILALLITFRTAHADEIARRIQCLGCEPDGVPVLWRLLFALVLGALAGAVSLMIRAHRQEGRFGSSSRPGEIFPIAGERR